MDDDFSPTRKLYAQQRGLYRKRASDDTSESEVQIMCDAAPAMVGKSEDMMWKSEPGSGETCDDPPVRPTNRGPQSRFGNLHILNDVNPYALNRRFGTVNVNPTQRSGS